MKRLFIILVWFPLTGFTLFTSLFFYSYYNQFLVSKRELKLKTERPKFYQMYASHPQALGISTSSVQAEDAIPELVYQYLAKYKSPMTDTAFDFVKIFRQHGIDPIVPLAIAQCESNLGTKVPPDCYNPFGLGIHSKGTLCFSNWQEGYEKMAKILKNKYADKGFLTIDQVMKKYCPVSVEKSNGSWAKCVKHFIKEIETFDIKRK